MSQTYGRSPLWELYNNTQVTREAVGDLSNFKSSEVNYKLALWDPRVNGVRYLKTLVFTLAAGLSPANWARLRRIANREVGDPFSITYDGEAVCMDYLQAVLEVEFIESRMTLDGARILEIGAGYGRTCHALLSNHEIAAYHIVDLENSLDLASRYLGAVLTDEQLAKVHFHGVDQAEAGGALRELRFDLAINIDSFAEMTPDTVGAYLDLIATHADHLYVNNPVGKYLDKSLDGHSQGDAVVQLALRTGLLRDIVDIFDDRAVAAQSRRFIDAYRPGRDWALLADARAVPWSFYWQALYRSGAAGR
ncbi:putative sugar O-methyltransferase [Micromonospora sp. WMMD956]|jgi:putative sugar O-methyltransferase|uniref:putative sugar O-methyltransferase n=1 Tax=Micromonospora TaxID=1873 RepID=UPI002416FF60|nr:putative sugar O-methyltransferase [Micromonospora sp. WMMD956]MDG4817133.1 putative sugar O-methyltransferase [Micromonospora sp. WMMD956]